MGPHAEAVVDVSHVHTGLGTTSGKENLLYSSHENYSNWWRYSASHGQSHFLFEKRLTKSAVAVGKAVVKERLHIQPGQAEQVDGFLVCFQQIYGCLYGLVDRDITVKVFHV